MDRGRWKIAFLFLVRWEGCCVKWWKLGGDGFSERGVGLRRGVSVLRNVRVLGVF